jgi:hypothetical protein
MAPSIRTLYIATLVVAAAGTALAADRDKQPAPSQPTPAIKRMNEEAGRHVPAPAPAPAPAPRAQPAPSPPTPAVRRMGPAGTGGVVNPPGWDQMTPAERERYQRDLDRTQSSEECRVLMQRQEQAARQRARERGLPPPGSPGRDLCARY